MTIENEKLENDQFKILVVDDERTNRAIIGLHLRRRGFNVVEAISGEEALENLALDSSIRLVLLDIVMPGLSGLEVLEVIRRSSSPTQLPVIMVTGEEGDANMIHAFELGANDYVIKPINVEVTMARIMAHLKESAAIRS